MFEKADFSKVCNSWSPILPGTGQYVTDLHHSYVVMMMIMIPNTLYSLWKFCVNNQNLYFYV
jgi:hypothetical protein